MDRSIIYSQEQGRSTDILFAQRAAVVGLAKLSEAVLGTTTVVSGLAASPTSPASLTVNVAPGQIYSVGSVDATAYGVLAADTADQVVKQGLSMTTQNLSCPAPTTTGYSINYLIEAIYQDQDLNNVVLPYYNSANPSQPLSGQNNTGAAQATERHGVCVLAVKAGAAATTGTQTTPTPDAGYVGLWVVTVAYGQATITSSNISQYNGAPFLPAGGAVTRGLQVVTSNTTLGAFAVDTAVIINSGSATTQTLPAANSVPAGREVEFLNIGSGVGTVPTAGADTIQLGTVSVNSVALAGGESLRVKSNGNNGWYATGGSAGTTGRLLNVQVITATGTYTPTTGTRRVRVTGCGGGGAGGGTPANATGFACAGSPGSGGSWFDSWITSNFSGVTVTIGAGGTGSSNAAGGSGGTTSFGALASAPGGVGGVAGTTSNSFPFATFGASSPSAATGGSIQNGTGEAGFGSCVLSSSNVSANRGGASCFGPGPCSASQNTAGAPGVNPGTGGCGPVSTSGTGALAGGNGAAGRVVIFEYA